jgi:hypothetical protein
MSVFKCMLTVSVLPLFAVQFSYNCQPAPGTVAVYHNISLDFNGKPKVHLCLDKRYALQPIFVLAGSLHRVATVFPAGAIFCPIDSHPAVAMVCRLHSLRGPPQHGA